MLAGTMAPPKAHRIGKEASRGVESSPLTTSLFISNPTNRKKIAINPSFIQSAAVYFKCIDAVSKPRSVFNTFSKETPKGELANINENKTQINSRIPALEGEENKFFTIFSITA